MKKPSESFDLK